MADGDFAEAVHYLAAIHMAVEGASDNAAALAVIEQIIQAGPKAEASDLWPTRILVDAIQQIGARIEVPA